MRIAEKRFKKAHTQYRNPHRPSQLDTPLNFHMAWVSRGVIEAALPVRFREFSSTMEPCGTRRFQLGKVSGNHDS